MSRLCVLIALALLSFSPQVSYALEIRLHPPEKLYMQDGVLLADLKTSKNLLAEASVKNFDYDIPFTITYYLELHERRFLLDKKISDIELIRHVRQDLWSKHFFVTENGVEKRFSEYADIDRMLTNLYGIEIAEKKQLKPDKAYYIKTRIAIKIRNFASFYYLINNLVSLFEYRTTYLTSRSYIGQELLDMKGILGDYEDESQ